MVMHRRMRWARSSSGPIHVALLPCRVGRSRPANLRCRHQARRPSRRREQDRVGRLGICLRGQGRNADSKRNSHYNAYHGLLRIGAVKADRRHR
jgi:hypothetical protein